MKMVKAVLEEKLRMKNGIFVQIRNNPEEQNEGKHWMLFTWKYTIHTVSLFSRTREKNCEMHLQNIIDPKTLMKPRLTQLFIITGKRAWKTLSSLILVLQDRKGVKNSHEESLTSEAGLASSVSLCLCLLTINLSLSCIFQKHWWQNTQRLLVYLKEMKNSLHLFTIKTPIPEMKLSKTSYKPSSDSLAVSFSKCFCSSDASFLAVFV